MRKKILFFIPTLMNGGAERVLVNLVNNLDTTQYDIHVKTVMNVGRYIDKLAKHITYSYIFDGLKRGTRFYFNMFTPEYLYNKYIGNDYDIIVSYLEGMTSRIVSGCKNPKTKKIAWIHIEMNTKNLFAKGFRSYKEAVKCYSTFDEIVCVSETVKQQFIDISNIKEHVRVLYNSNNTIEIVKLAKEPVTDMQFDTSGYTLCSVAKIESSKGYDRLARIHKKLLDNGIKNSIYIIGEGSETKNIEKYLKENNLQSSFVFIGYKENPYKYMKRCDLYVCSSRREGFSTAVTEALVLGIPVVSTNCSGAYELLGYNNEYGIVTDNTTEALYEGLCQMLKSKQTLEDYKVKAQHRGLRFSLKETIDAVEKIF